MSHFTLQCHKLQLLLWQFAESIPSESLFCVKSWTCDSWRFPDFNGLCWCSIQCGLCLHFTYVFIYSFSHSFNRYLLSSHCVPGSVPTGSLCPTTFVVECCSGLMCCKHRQEGWMGTWGTLKNPCEGDSLLREISFWGVWTLPQTAQRNQALLVLSEAPLTLPFSPTRTSASGVIFINLWTDCWKTLLMGLPGSQL